MQAGPPAPAPPHAAPQPRISPISFSALVITLSLLTAGTILSFVTQFTLMSLPNIVLLVIAVVTLDVLIQFAPQNRITTAAQHILYGVLYLVVTCVCGVLAAYAMQRMSFPLQDRFLTGADRFFNLDWLAYAQWVDGNALVQTVLRTAYDSIAFQIALPVFVLACAGRLHELRLYLLAFVIAFITTIFISALMPAAGPIEIVDRAAFQILRFTGATPIDHLTRLREAGPLMMADFPGGIATFPSFHSTVAVLTPLTLRHHRVIFAGLLLLDAAMLAGTVTEGAHYFVDVFAGCGMAFLAHAVAKQVIGLEDRLSLRRVLYARSTASSAPAAFKAPQKVPA